MRSNTGNALFVDDRELIKRLRLPKSFNCAIFQALEDKEIFPKRDPDFGGKRYYPAVISWLNHFHRVDRSAKGLSPAEACFLTANETSKRLGVGIGEFKVTAQLLARQGLPMPSTLFANRRYWPAVKSWLDKRYGLEDTSLKRADGRENAEAFRRKRKH